jgi:hypothetical protein
MRNQQASNCGSVLLWAVVTLAILSIFAAEVIRVVNVNYHTTLQTSTWQESLLASESGIDLAIVELRKSLYPAPNHAWDGWSGVPGDGEQWGDVAVDRHAGDDDRGHESSYP